MLLDLPTAAFFVIILFAIQALVTVLFTILARSYRGTGSWAVGNMLVVVGAILVGMRDIIPDFLSVIVANTLYIFALGFLYFGVRQFLGLRDRAPRWYFAIPLLVAVLLIYFTYGRNDMVTRSIIMSAVMASCMVITARLLFSQSHPTVRHSHWFTATIFVIFAGFHFLRIVPLLASPLPESMTLNLLFSIPMVVSSICGVLWTAGIALMITERLMVELHHTASHDFLTHMLNRRAAQTRLETEIRRVRRKNVPLSILLIDIDHFKRINDQYGHEMGDAVLVALADRLTKAGNGVHRFARWGGEEFMLILPDTAEEIAYQTAQHVQHLIAATPFLINEVSVTCSVSIGVATATPQTADLDDVLRRADNALYQAKDAGRNMVVIDRARLAQFTP